METVFEPAASPADPSQPSPSRRVILLGASNVVRAISTIVETVELIWEPPLDVLAACGHGRSFGRTSCVFGRSLPGILQCGLWQDWQRRPALPTAALVSDIGNDILYGASVDQIAEWVEQCLARLRGACDRIVITELPLAAPRVRQVVAVPSLSLAAVSRIARDVRGRDAASARVERARGRVGCAISGRVANAAACLVRLGSDPRPARGLVRSLVPDFVGGERARGDAARARLIPPLVAAAPSAPAVAPDVRRAAAARAADVYAAQRQRDLVVLTIRLRSARAS